MASSQMVFFSFTRFIPNTLDLCLCWLLRRVWFGKSRGVQSWGSFGFFCRSELLAFHRLISSGVSALVAGLLVFFRSSGSFLGYCLSLIPCLLREFFKVIGCIALRLQSMPQELLSLHYVVIVSWRRRFRGISFCDIWRLILMAAFSQIMWRNID